ncbi:MAG: Mn2+/Fe2+ NRAMP family transporter [Planctomycetota bacterium]|jgi:Mn2+/Fe2+ NRAMP family transporter
MFAAVAVGVSHLVQSTRAGATYGLTLAGLIVFACLVKYPAFRFGAEYGAATGKPLLNAYERQGRWVLIVYLIGLPFDLFVATAAIVLVTSGVFKNIFQINLNDIWLSLIILISCATLLMSGRYKLFENITKFIVVLFSILTVIAAALSVPELHWETNDLTREVVFDQTTILFMIAIAGWMPTAVSVSMFQSIWVCEKAKSLNRPITTKEARFDFNVGYISTIILALCFVLMGTALMYNTGMEIESSPSRFAGQLIAMFTQVIGPWAKPLIALAALAVMVSTTLGALDVGPRIMGSVLQLLMPDRRFNDNKFHLVFLVTQVIGATLILVFFMKSFKTFIDFATSVAFLSAPALAWFNHRAIYSDEIDPALRPGKIMRLWSLLGIAVMLIVATYYLSTKLF